MSRAAQLRATVVTGLSQALTLGGAALLGVLIAARFGSDARTDGFFFANSVYAIVLFVGQSLRTTSVAALIEDPRAHGPQLALAVGLLGLLAAAVFVVLGLVVVPIATGDLPSTAQDTAQETLAILWPAAVLQLFSGLTAALLATRDRYGAAAWAWTAGSAVSIAGFLALTPSMGIDGVPLAMVGGVMTTFAILTAAARRAGGLPVGRAALRRSVHRAGQLLLGSSGLIAAQLLVASSVAFAATVGEGGATTYSYAVMAISAVMAATITPVNIVFAPVVAREWDRTPEMLGRAAIRTFRAGTLLAAPTVAALELLGPAPAHWLLPALGDHTIDEIFAVALILSPTLLTTLCAAIPELGLLTQQRFAALAGIAGGTVLVHLALSGAVIAAGGGLRWLAAAAIGTSTALATAMLRVALGPHAWTVGRRVLAAIAQLAVPGAVAFAGATLALQPGGALAAGAAAWALGALVYGAWLWLTRRAELAELAGAAGLRAS